MIIHYSLNLRATELKTALKESIHSSELVSPFAYSFAVSIAIINGHAYPLYTRTCYVLQMFCFSYIPESSSRVSGYSPT